MGGGTDTFFLVYGDAEWNAAILSVFVGLSTEEACGTTEAMRRENGTHPDERVMSHIRLCRSCAARSKLAAHLYTTAEVEAFQRDGGEARCIAQTDEIMRNILDRQ
jgi:hypothetical protein